ncbi:MAG: GNAT family N-acetyltransferase [Burkholderiaceae bacterium]
MIDTAPPALPGPDCQLRLLREAELPAYKGLRDFMLARHPDAFTSDAETELRREADSYRSRLSGGANGGCLFTLAAWQGRPGGPGGLDGQMVGAISCEREPRRKVRHIAHVVGMMVRDDAQGQGVGRMLLQQALRLLQGEPSLELAILSVTAGNQRAVRLYERCGFIRYGRLEGAIRFADGTLLDKDLMRRRLR